MNASTSPSRLFSTIAAWVTRWSLSNTVIGQGHALPAHLEPAVGEGVGVDILPGEPGRHLVLYQHDPLALVGQSELLPDIALLAVAEDVAQTVGGDVQRPVQIVRTGREQRRSGR